MIYSKTFDDYLIHLKQVFHILQQNKLYANLKKCEFLKDKVEYLGHVVTIDGLQPDPAKCKAIFDWPTPVNVSELRSFLGLANYYRRFMKDYAKIVAPLTDLLHKNELFV